MKEDKPGWQKAKRVEMVYVKYDLKNNLPTHESTLPNHREKEVKASTSAVFITNEPFQTHRQHIWAFHSWPLPWNLLAPSDALYGLTIGHVGTQYVPV